MHLTVADWIGLLGGLITFELALAHGTIQLSNAIPEKWIPTVQAWANIFAGFNGIVVGILSRYTGAILLAVILLGGSANAQAPRPRPLTGDAVKDIKSAIGQGSNEASQSQVGGTSSDKLAQILAKPFNDLADFINTDAADAATLATAIPGLQDGHGQQCWMAMGQFTAVIKAHPIPLTLHAATDLEAFRLANMAANNLCSNVHCTQVFSDLSNAVQQVAGQIGGAIVTGGLQIPSLNSLCSKVPQVIVAAPAPPDVPTTPK